MKFTQEHRDILFQESGINSKSIEKFKLRSSIKGIDFDYHDLEGQKIGTRTKLTPPEVNPKDPSRLKRYHQGCGTSLTCYFSIDDIEKLKNPNMKIFITEGEKKLIRLKQILELSEYPMASYPGCWNWGKKKEDEILKLSTIWNQIPLENREVIWIPDTDFFTNHHTRNGMIKFTDELVKKGAIIKVIDLRYKGKK